MNLSLNDRKNLVEISNFDISVKRQCELLGLNRSSLYYKSSSDISDLSLKNCIDEIYTESPFYGSRRIAFIAAERLEIAVNRKKVQRIMQEMSIVGIYPLDVAHRQKKLFFYDFWFFDGKRIYIVVYKISHFYID